MTNQEHLLTIVAEECSEVHQRCSKALRFGLDEVQEEQSLNNSQRIIQEFNDLVAAMELLYNCPISDLLHQEQIKAKKIKVEKFLLYSAKCGTLQ